jgi:DNA polymerase III sliding clamp (beta) subunit (PCNA family)
MLLDALKIIRGAVSDKDLVPVLTHVAVHEGRLHGFDGRIHISTPAPALKGYSFTVPMIPFLAAVEACDGEPALQIGEALIVTGKKFRAVMPLGKMEAFPMPDMEGKKIKVQGLLAVLKALRPFIGQDAMRPWSAGILFQGGVAMATNNIVLIEAETDRGMELMPRVALPVFAVDEIIALGMEPQSIAVTENAAFLHYAGRTWLRTVLLEDHWPDAKAILQDCHNGATFKPVHTMLEAAVQQIVPFCPDPKHPVIRFKEGVVSTLDGSISASVGGFGDAGVGLGAFRAEPLLAVLKIAEDADWSLFPRVPFLGSAEGTPLSGVLLGLQL